MDKAIDLSHHLSESSRSRMVSPLKALQKYAGKPGLISLAGGLPDPAYFPFASISGDALIPESFPRTKPSESSLFAWFWNIFGTSASSEKFERISVPKYAAQEGDVDLAVSLQYGPATGIKALQAFVTEFSLKVFRPLYKDCSTLMHAGNTDGVLKVLCNPGDLILAEEWSYPSVIVAAQSLGISLVSIKVDGGGMSAIDLENVLSTWDETARKNKRPTTMYTIPVGQNPTGLTMDIERKKAIYAVCVKYDVVIIEDDPYYFLQEGTYYPKEVRAKSKSVPPPKTGEDEETRYINSLVPSYLSHIDPGGSIDYQGRVIRMDTFSKTIAPGARLGWFTCNPLFAERLEREGETSTQAPCGFSQSLITTLVSTHWGFPKFIRWLQGLQTQYTIRRDFFVDCIFDEFEIRPASGALKDVFGAGQPSLTAYVKNLHNSVTQEKNQTKTPLFSFVPPTAGMFVWLKFHVYDRVPCDTGDGASFEDRLWTDLADSGLLICPGYFFDAEQSEPGLSRESQEIAYRLAFSMGSNETMKAGIQILAQVLNKYA
ncbi:PLP-dependent transferase [Ramaria rubella]|nr:PLP-dependent transferase [Ramaria rubella]